MDSCVNDNSIQLYAIERLNIKFTDGSLDQERVVYGHDDDTTQMSERCAKYTVDGKRILSKMPLRLFRQCLIEHFYIKFKNNSIVWPQRFSKPDH